MIYKPLSGCISERDGLGNILLGGHVTVEGAAGDWVTGGGNQSLSSNSSRSVPPAMDEGPMTFKGLRRICPWLRVTVEHFWQDSGGFVVADW